MSGTVSTTTEVILVDSRIRNGTVSLPLSSQIPNRILTIKDAYGNANLSSITIQTQGSDTFENGATSITLALPYEHLTVYAGLANKWIVQGGSRSFGFTASTISSVYANIGSLSASTINGLPASNYVSTGSLLSTTFGVLCTISTAVASGVGAGVTSTISTSWFMTSSVFASSISSLTANISSLTVNSLQIGNGTSWLDSGPLRATALSTLQLNAGAAYTTSNYFGTTSSGTALLFYGLQGGFQQTALAELSTGVGTQELLVFKGSSVSDRIRMQTTGSIVFEPGVAARIFSTTLTPPSNATPAMIINASSNVGIQTATPQTALDVAGTIRGQTISSLAMFGSTLLNTSISTQFLTVKSTLRVESLFGSTPSLFVNLSSQIGLNVSTPLAQLHLKDLPYPTPTIPMSIFDKDSTSINSVVQQYSGVYVLYTVPSAVNSINFYMWGAGGAFTYGGGGAFISCTVPTTPGETLRFIIGLGGSLPSINPTDPQGNAGCNSPGNESGRGGGRTAVQKFISGSWTEIATAGGGGGGCGAFGGGIGGGNARWVGQSEGGGGGQGTVGGGATQIAGGTGTNPGTFQRGGNAFSLGGSGGGGYYGGGGGNNSGAGGGSSFVLSTLSAAPFVSNFIGIDGNRNTAIGTTYPGYVSGVGVAGTTAGNGLISLQFSGFRESDYVNFSRAGTVVFSVNAGGGASLGKATVTSNYLLDINGNLLTTQATTTTVSTQSLLTSSIQAGIISSASIFTSSIQTNTLSVSSLSSLAFYASTINVGGSVIAQSVSSLQFYTSSLLTNSLFTSTLSTLDVATSSLEAATVQASTLSSMQVFTSSLQANTLSSLQFYTSSIQASALQVSSLSTASLRVGFLQADSLSSITMQANSISSVSFVNTGTICTNSLIVYGPSTFVNLGSTIFSGPVFLNGQITGDNNLITSSMLISTTSGLAASGVSSTLSTFLFLTSSIRASSIFTDGTQTIQFTGTASDVSFGTNTDTLTLATKSDPYTGAIASMAFGVSTNAYPLARIYALDSAISGSPLSQLVFQNVPVSGTMTEAMRIATNGYLGIGTTKPATPLDVAGTGRFQTMSTLVSQTSSLLTNSLQLGTTSSINSLTFFGLQGGYNQTALAELSTGTGLQELLMFKGSSVSDRIRMQTTGSIVFEPGVASRVFSSDGTTTGSNLTPAMIVNASSNVGIKTATPQATLDVAGTGRFQTLSTLQTNTSSLTLTTLTAAGSTILSGPVFLTGQLTGVNNLITSSMLTSTVAGLGQLYLSTATAGGVTSTLSTSMLFTSSIRASSIFTDGTQTIQFTGSASGALYGPNVDTLTLATKNAPYTNAIASMAFGVSTNAYPLARIYAIDSAISGSPLSQLVFQNVPTSPTTFTSNYTYTGADQTFVVPTGVTSMQVTLWGAGGGGGTGVGGAGTYVQGTLIVSPGQTYRVVVGQGGVYQGSTTTYGGGGAATNGPIGAGSGGGRSGVQLLLTSQITSASGSGSAITFTFNANHGLQTGQPINVAGLSPAGFTGNFAVASMPSGTQITVVSTQTGSSTGTGTVYAEVVNAGAGGGGGTGSPGTGAPAAFSGSGFNAPPSSGNLGGEGGSQTAGGAGGGSGSGILQGGTSQGNYAGGGGSGFYGGGGGRMSPGNNTGGGGGSSYTSYAAFTLTAGSNSPNTGNQAPATTAAGYISGVAVGGNGTANGGSGLVLLNSIGGTITEAMRIGSNGFLGIGITAPTTTLDVAGTGRFQTVSTLALNISTINGAVLAGPSGWSAFPALQTVNFSGSTLSNIGSTLYVKTQNFDPRSIKGLQTWLDASDPSTFIFTAGSNINRWLDKSGQGNHTSNAGTVVASTLSVVFNGAGMNSPLNASGMVSNTFKEYGFVVFTTSANNAYTLVGPSYFQGRQINIQNGGAITNFNNGGETIANIAVANWANTQPQLLDWSSGGYLALNASNLVNSGSNYTSYMGPWNQRTTSFGTSLVGTIREVIIYQGVTLSSNEVYAVEGYLASKWGFQTNLPPAHLYKTVDIRTSSITTYDGTASVDAANNMVLQPADYLTRVNLTFPNTSPNLILNGHVDMRMTILDTSIMNTGIGIYPTIGSFGTTYRIPYASGGVTITFPVFISSNDIGGYWDFYNNSGSNQAIVVTNGNGIANFTLTPFATTRAIWNGTANYLTSASPWPTYLTQDVGNTRLGINVAPAYTLDVTGSSRFTSNVGIGIVPNTGLIALDVANQARFGSISTLQVFTSSINANTLSAITMNLSSMTLNTLSAITMNMSSMTLNTLSAITMNMSSITLNTLSAITMNLSTIQTTLVSTLRVNVSSINATTISATTMSISTISTTALVFGDGTGFVDVGDILATSVSTILTFTGALYATSNFLGTQSSLTALQFFGLQGAYNNTVLAEMSTGIGSQEFLLFKGSSAQDRVRTQTTGTIVFEAGMPQRLFSTGQVGSNSTPTMILTSTSVGIFLSTPQATLDVGGTARALILSTLNLNISSINNASYPPPSGVGVVVSTSKLLTSSLQASSISSFQAYFSTLTIDTLTVGTGAGWFDLGPVRTTALSTFQANIDSNYTNNLFIGNQSSINDILFFGLQGNYNNTALAEISTGTGLQEFLVFKGSSVSDRIRMQTTGSIIFEPGVSARLFSTNGATTGSNLTPAMIINASSNVGIQTATPAANTALDVAGTGRFQTLSTLSLYAGAIYGGVFFA